MAVEPIVRSDGDKKNDCERNAIARLIKRVRKQHPKLKLLVIEDGLSSNAPRIADLKAEKMHFLLGAKPGDHEHLFDQVHDAMDRDEVRVERARVASGKATHDTQTQYIEDLELNKSNSDVRVNFLQHHHFDGETAKTLKCFSWVTDLDLSGKSLGQYQRAGRCRWRVENETFNTLKNQGYQLEHNYGHGKTNLMTVLALLMFLAFAVDQIQEACCGLYAAAVARSGRRIRLGGVSAKTSSSLQVLQFRGLVFRDCNGGAFQTASWIIADCCDQSFSQQPITAHPRDVARNRYVH
ncbi:hypothetical protein [Rhodopirellula europaea]|uniref:hypothetical protein n=1 Tax=Rhodopirellula europaea TaxID=1263866 RepID=UPI003D278021